MIFITVLMIATCSETATLVIQVIIWVINVIKSGSSNFCKDLPLFHPVYTAEIPVSNSFNALRELSNEDSSLRFNSAGKTKASSPLDKDIEFKRQKEQSERANTSETCIQIDSHNDMEIVDRARTIGLKS